MRILIVDDDVALRESLEGEMFQVTSADSSDDAIDLLKLYEFDLCLLNISTLQVIKRVRDSKITTPIIILSDSSAVEHKVRALTLGADDFLTRPFHNDELAARIRAIVRRSRGHADSTIVVGDLTLNLETRTAWIGAKMLRLTIREYQMLELLCLRKGKIVTKEQFMLHLYNERDEPEIKIVDVFLCKLRKKIADAAGKKNLIETVWGQGYSLRDPNISMQPSPTIAPEIADLTTGSLPIGSLEIAQQVRRQGRL